jgi:hypothetical protein
LNSFIHLFLSNTDKEPPFTIPQLRFSTAETNGNQWNPLGLGEATGFCRIPVQTIELTTKSTSHDY